MVSSLSYLMVFSLPLQGLFVLFFVNQILTFLTYTFAIFLGLVNLCVYFLKLSFSSLYISYGNTPLEISASVIQ